MRIVTVAIVGIVDEPAPIAAGADGDDFGHRFGDHPFFMTSEASPRTAE